MLYKSALFNKCYYKGSEKKNFMYGREAHTGKYVNAYKAMT